MSEFEKLITGYLARVDDGEQVSSEEMLTSYPEHEPALRQFFAVLDSVTDRSNADQSGTVGRDPSTVLPTPGVTVLGDYRLIRELGRGGMGVVYEAEQISLSRRVALKVLHAPAATEHRLMRFRQEIQAVASLKHEHIVPVLAIGEEQGHHFFSMPLIEGQPLKEVIRSVHHFSEPAALWRSSRGNTRRFATDASSGIEPGVGDEDTSSIQLAEHLFAGTSAKRFDKVVKLLEAVAAALHHAHERGIIHRDIKPSNLLLDSQGKIWVADFGLAHFENEATVTVAGEILGTLQYMSPEQAQGHHKRIDRRTDVYSLGVVMYLLLTGYLPFRGQHQQVVKMVVQDDPPPPRQLNSRVPTDLETICLKCLQKAPEDRYRTAANLAEDLQRYREGKPIQAKPAGLLKRLSKWCRRRPLAASIVGMVALATMMTVGLSLNHARVVNNLVAEKLEAFEEKERAFDVAKAKSEQLREKNYAYDMEKALEGWNRGWWDEVRHLLDAQVPEPGERDFRGFEWDWLDRLSWLPDPVVIQAHDGIVYDVAVFADGERMVSVGQDESIRIWEIGTQKLLQSMRDPRTDTVRDIAGAANRIFGSMKIPDGFRAVAVSPDGTKLVTGHQYLTLWDLTTERIERDLTLFPTRIFGVDFSPDGTLVAAHAPEADLRIFSLDGNTVQRLETDYGSYRLTFSPNGEHILAPANYSGGTHASTWSVKDWKQRRYVKAAGRGVAYSSDSKFFFVGRADSTITAVDVERGKSYTVGAAERGKINDIAISPDDRVLAATYGNGALVYWILKPDWKTSPTNGLALTRKLTEAHEGAANAVRFIDEQRMVTTGDDGCLRIWQVDRQIQETKLNFPMASHFCAYTPDGASLLTTTAWTIRKCDATTGELQFELPMFDPSLKLESRITAMALDAKGRLAVVGNHLGEVVVVDLVEQSEIHRFQQKDVRVSEIMDVAFSVDGKWLAVGSSDHTVRIRSTKDWQEIKRYTCPGWGTAVEFSPDGEMLAYADSEGDVAVVQVGTWEVQCRKQLTSPIGHGGAMKFTFDSQGLVCGHNDAKIRVLEVATLEELAKMSGHARAINGLDIHPDGRRIISSSSGGEKGTIRLWYLPTRTEIGQLKTGKARCCRFSPSGQQLVMPVGTIGSRRPVIYHLWDTDNSTSSGRPKSR